MLAAEIAELAQEWCGWPIEFSGPASEEQIAAAEKELQVTFPRSYRAFLRHFGAGTTPYYEIYGVPNNRLWGDVVMMNQLSVCSMPPHYIKFTDSVGDYTYYLDTSQMDRNGECPVVVFGPGDEGAVVAESFVDFLRKASVGLV